MSAARDTGAAPDGPRRPLDRWSLLDRTGLVDRIVTAARQLPGVELAEDEYARAERAALRELKALLVAADDERPSPRNSSPPLNADRTRTPAERMDALLRRSMEQTPEESRRSLIELLLTELTPDEARILSALSDGSAYPLVHVATAGMPGGRGERVLANASSVGRAAGVALPQHTPTYVTHLRTLGLVRVTAEDPAMGDEYSILLTDVVVREALTAAAGAGRIGPRVTRRTLVISDLGRELWLACAPS